MPGNWTTFKRDNNTRKDRHTRSAAEHKRTGYRIQLHPPRSATRPRSISTVYSRYSYSSQSPHPCALNLQTHSKQSQHISARNSIPPNTHHARKIRPLLRQFAVISPLSDLSSTGEFLILYLFTE